jgi:UDP-3-O-[3-hydroxymyristoyl] glucosamine N-acyltransferase
MRSYTNQERLNYAKSMQSASGAVLMHESVTIGQNCSIGSDGFGYAREEDGTLVKMPHRGGVVIEENVTIHNNVCIDRGVIGDTVIGAGTKIDNLVHIAHGVKIGKNCLIVAGTVIGGSSEVGDNCFLGINCSIKNKVKIGNNVTVGMGAIVLADVPDNTTVIGVWKGNK